MNLVSETVAKERKEMITFTIGSYQIMAYAGSDKPVRVLNSNARYQENQKQEIFHEHGL